MLDHIAEESKKFKFELNITILTNIKNIHLKYRAIEYATSRNKTIPCLRLEGAIKKQSYMLEKSPNSLLHPPLLDSLRKF